MPLGGCPFAIKGIRLLKGNRPRRLILQSGCAADQMQHYDRLCLLQIERPGEGEVFSPFPPLPSAAAIVWECARKTCLSERCIQVLQAGLRPLGLPARRKGLVRL